MSTIVSVLQNGISNVGSVCNALTFLGIPFEIISDKAKLAKAKILIFPGVGAFGAAMAQLEKEGLTEPLREKLLTEKIPFLGICLGLQLLFESSEESPGVSGLGIFKGKVVRLTDHAPEYRVPNIGWCKLLPSHTGSSSISKDFINQSVYFVHSYAAQPEDTSIISLQAQHTQRFVAGVAKDNICAFQFHPEKSGTVGLNLLKNFVQWSSHEF